MTRDGAAMGRAASALVDARPIPYWLDGLAPSTPAPPLTENVDVDLAIIGGGYTGLWAAIEAKERDPGRDVLLLEAGRIGWGASGRNGGFVAASLTHGLGNGIDRFPDEIVAIERQGSENLTSIRDAIVRLGIEAEWEARPTVLLARSPHQTAWFARAVRLHERFGYPATVLGRDEVQ